MPESQCGGWPSWNRTTHFRLLTPAGDQRLCWLLSMSRSISAVAKKKKSMREIKMYTASALLQLSIDRLSVVMNGRALQEESRASYNTRPRNLSEALALRSEKLFLIAASRGGRGQHFQLLTSQGCPTPSTPNSVLLTGVW